MEKIKIHIIAIFFLLFLLQGSKVNAIEMACNATKSCVLDLAEKIDFSLPISLDEAYISTDFSDFHPGIDLASTQKEEHPNLKAIGPGKVIYADNSSYDWENGSAYGGYGNVVVIDHLNGLYSLYAHLNEITVKKGQLVDKGKIIGTMGATGNSTGTHLHLEICSFECKGDSSTKYNPQSYLDIKKFVTRLE